MRSTLTSQPPQIKARLHTEPDESEAGPLGGDGRSEPRASSLGDFSHQYTAEGQNRSQLGRKLTRLRIPSERPLLVEIERQELSERLIAILNELRSRRDSSGTENDGGHEDG
jgi:hypothetical protein